MPEDLRNASMPGGYQVRLIVESSCRTKLPKPVALNHAAATTASLVAPFCQAASCQPFVSRRARQQVWFNPSSIGGGESDTDDAIVEGGDMIEDGEPFIVLCLLFMCLSSPSRRAKAFLHTTHSKVALKCVLRCLDRFEDSLKVLPQMSHLSGFSPVCVRMCMAAQASWLDLCGREY